MTIRVAAFLFATLFVTTIAQETIAQCTGSCPPPDYVCNGDFTNGSADQLQDWSPYCQGNFNQCACNAQSPVNCVVAVTEGSERFARADVRQAAVGESWRLKLRQKDHNLDCLRPDRTYEMTFRARTASSSPAAVTLAQVESPSPESGACGLTWAVMRLVLEGGNVWRDYKMTFRTPGTLDQLRTIPGFGPCVNKALPEEQLVIGLGEQAGIYDIDAVHITELTAPQSFPNPSDGTLPLDLGTFEPSAEYWFAQKDRNAAPGDGLEVFGSPGANHELKMTLGPNGGLLAYRYVYLSVDPSRLQWDLALDVRTDTPLNVGRMYVVLRSTRPTGDSTENFLLHSFGGLHQGLNSIKAGSVLTTVSPDAPDICFNQSDVSGTGKVCDIFQPWFSQEFQWSNIYTLGIKLETNDNGPAVVYVDNLRLDPWNKPAPSPARRAPIVSRVRVKGLSSTQTGSQATVAWQTEQCARSKVEYGLQPGSYTFTTEDPADTLRDHDVTILQNLQAGTRYHARVASASCYTECAGGSCAPDPCAPCAAEDPSKVGYSGDFTFVTPPWPSPVPAPGPQDPAFYPVGVQGVPMIADLPLAVDSGFNAVQSSLFGGCYALPPPQSGNPDVVRENARATAFLDASSQYGVKAIVSNFCTQWVKPACDGGLPDTALPGYVAAKVDAVENKPALYGYYLFDEPEFYHQGPGCPPENVQNVLIPRLAALYSAAKSADADPDAPMTTGTTYFSSTHPYRNSIDRPLNDIYPFPLHPLEWIINGDGPDQGDGLAELETEVASAGKQYEYIFQAYSSELDKAFPVGREVTVYPTEKQMRAMAYLGVVYNARGIWNFAMSQIESFPGTEWMWNGLSNVARELRRLEPVLADTEPLTHPPASSANLKTGIKEYQGSSYLVTVNATNQACAQCSVNLGTPHLYLPNSQAVVLEENRSIDLNPSEEVKTDWDAYQVRVFKVPRDIQPPQVTSLTRITQRVRKNAPIVFSVTATDNAGLDKLVFEVVSLPSCSVSRAVANHPRTDTQQFTCTFPANGPYVIKARAFDVNNPTAPSNDATLNLSVPTN